MARGVKSACPNAVIDYCPLADGGDGTMDTLVAAAGGMIEQVSVCGPLPGTKISADIGWLTDGKTAVIDLASASGLLRLTQDQRDPTRTTTFGTGELIAHAVRGGARRIIIGVGGSATCDGGLGIAQACGAAIRLRSGKSYAWNDRKITGADAGKVISLRRGDAKAVEASDGLLRYAGVEIVVAADVGNPLFGTNGAAEVFAPQKGASPAQVKLLDEGLKKLSQRLELNEHARRPGAGAGGGAAFGLMAFFGASIISGAHLVFNHLHLNRRLKGVDLCLTGEGRFDLQSLGGKAPFAVAQACYKARVPCVVIAGQVGIGIEPAYADGVTAALSIMSRPMAQIEAEEHAAELVAATAENVTRLYRSGLVHREK